MSWRTSRVVFQNRGNLKGTGSSAMKITPLAVPIIDWASFVTDATASLGRSPTRSLDGADVAPGDFKSYLQALGELQTPKTSPLSYLRSEECRPALEHLWFSFLFDLEAPAPLHILTYGRVSVLTSVDNPRLFVGSGTMLQWRDLVINGSRVGEARETRAAMNELLRIFARLGLADLFRGYRHEQHRDGTTILCDR